LVGVASGGDADGNYSRHELEAREKRIKVIGFRLALAGRHGTPFASYTADPPAWGWALRIEGRGIPQRSAARTLSARLISMTWLPEQQRLRAKSLQPARGWLTAVLGAGSDASAGLDGKKAVARKQSGQRAGENALLPQ